MRRFYRSQAPVVNKSISEDMADWDKRNKTASTSEMEEEEEMRIRKNVTACLADEAQINDSEMDDSIHFMLKTNAGTLSYKPSQYSNYTDFLRVVIEMSLAFNSGEVDPEFTKVIRRAFAVYEGTEDFDDENDGDDEYDNSDDIDFVPTAIENAKNEADKWEKADKYVKALPKAEILTIKILQADSESTNTKAVEKILGKMTDLPPNIMHAVVHKHQPFSLPYQKASDVYVQLRMLGIPLTIKSEDAPVKSITKSAAKKSIKKTTANSGRGKKTVTKKVSAKKTSVKKTDNINPLTGREKLRDTVGIIKSE